MGSQDGRGVWLKGWTWNTLGASSVLSRVLIQPLSEIAHVSDLSEAWPMRPVVFFSLLAASSWFDNYVLQANERGPAQQAPGAKPSPKLSMRELSDLFTE